MNEEINANEYVKELIELEKQINDLEDEWWEAFRIANADKLQRKRILVALIGRGNVK